MPIDWNDYRKPGQLSDDEILAAAAMLASACMLAKHGKDAECAGLMRQFDGLAGRAVARLSQRFRAEQN